MWLFVLVLVCLLAPAGRAITVEDVFREPAIEGTRAQSAKISPDERWVAYAWNPDGYRAPLNLYVVGTRGGAPRRLTEFARRGVVDSLQAHWRTLRETVGNDTSAALDTLPEYFDPVRFDNVEAIEWSPDSRSIAFASRGDLYVVGVDGSKLRQLTRTSDSEGEPHWSPDGRSLAFLRGRSVWLFEMHAIGEIELTKPAGEEESLSLLSWSPSGRHVAFVITDDAGRGKLTVPHYLPERVASETVRDGYPNQRVQIVDVTKRTAVKLDLGEGKHPLVGPLAWSPSGAEVAIDETLPDMRTRRIHVATPAGAVKRVYAETDSAWIDTFDWVIADGPVLEWSPDGTWLLFTTERTGFQQLVRLRVNAPDAEPEALTTGAWLVDWARWLPDGQHIVLMTSRKTTSERHFERLDLGTRALTRLETATGMNTHPMLGKQGQRLVYLHSRFAKPPDLWTVEPSPKRPPRQLTHTVPDRFQALTWTVPEIVQFPGRDGTPLHGLVYRPRDFDASQRYPVVVFVHGAGVMQNVVDGWTIYSPNFKFHTVLAELGFVVFEVDYRGSLGYGRDFRTGIHMYIGGNDLQDELAGIDYLRRQPFVDAERIGIYGGSYGGFMALMALFLAPQDYACGAALRFVSDWDNYYKGNPWYCIQRLGKPEDNPDAYYRSSPIHFAENLVDPLLLLHGVRDDNVHFQDAAQLIERLIRLGKDFELMIYPVERHGFTEPASWIDEYRRIERFFVEHLAPPARSP